MAEIQRHHVDSINRLTTISEISNFILTNTLDIKAETQTFFNPQTIQTRIQYFRFPQLKREIFSKCCQIVKSLADDQKESQIKHFCSSFNCKILFPL